MRNLLSIIIPIYNASATIDRTLDSLNIIASECRSMVQVVVVDDGSTDDGLSRVQTFALQNPDIHWDFHVQPNAGANVARNTALDLAQGEWVFFLDADDELRFDPTTLLMEPGETTCFAMTLVYDTPRGSKTVVPPPISEDVFWEVFSSRNPYPCASLLFRRDRISTHFSRDIRTCEDWLFMMQNPQIFHRMVVRADIQSACIHIHGSNTSSNYQKMGQGRSDVARRILDSQGHAMTRKQRNNFLIQEQIGRMQAGAPFSCSFLMKWPCDPTLFIKAVIYLFARCIGWKATRY